VYFSIRPEQPWEEAQPDNVIHVEVRQQNVHPGQIGRKCWPKAKIPVPASRITVEFRKATTSTQDVFSP
jgi:hypothetical protein